MDQELQQPMRIERLPYQGQREFQHLARGAERGVVLKAGTGHADALEGVVQDDAVVGCHGHRSGAIREAAHQFGRRLRGDIARHGAQDDQRAVARKLPCRLAAKRGLQLADIRPGIGGTRWLVDGLAVEPREKTTPQEGQIVRMVEQRDRLHLRATFLDQGQDVPQPLAHARRQPVLRQCFDSREVGEPLRNAHRERAVPAVQIPAGSPIEKRACDAHRIDAERAVVEARQVVEVGEAAAIQRDLLGGVDRRRGDAQITLEQA